MKCDRCRKPAPLSSCSWFNTQTLCGACSKEEEAHPDYRYARDREREAVIAGDYNFPGVGWPGVDGRVEVPQAPG